MPDLRGAEPWLSRRNSTTDADDLSRVSDHSRLHLRSRSFFFGSTSSQQILHCRLQDRHVIPELPDPNVARRAKQAAELASSVIVVDA